MTLLLPIYHVGRNCTSVRVTPMSLNLLTGAFTKGAVYDIGSLAGNYLTFNEAHFDLRVDNEEISPANSFIRNHVLTKDDYEVTLSELKYNDPTKNVIPWNAWAVDYFLVEIVSQPYAGAYSNPFTIQAVCVRMSLSNPYAEGKQAYELHGTSCGFPIAFIPQGSALTY